MQLNTVFTALDFLVFSGYGLNMKNNNNVIYVNFMRDFIVAAEPWYRPIIVLFGKRVIEEIPGIDPGECDLPPCPTTLVHYKELFGFRVLIREETVY